MQFTAFEWFAIGILGLRMRASRMFQGWALTCALVAVFPVYLVNAQTGSEADDSDARSLFELGQTAMGQGRFEAALRHFREAYRLSGRPQLLFNIAAAADRLRDDRTSLEALESYLALVPDAPDRAAVEARIRILRDLVARAQVPTAPAVPVPAEPIHPAPEQPSQTAEAPEAEIPDVEAGAEPTHAAAEPTVASPAPEIAPTDSSVEPLGPDAAPDESHARAYVWIAAGAALTVGGAVVGAFGLRDRADVLHVADGATWDSIRDAHARAPRRIVAGATALGAGAALFAVAGAILARDDDATRAHVVIGPSAIYVRGSFR